MNIPDPKKTNAGWRLYEILSVLKFPKKPLGNTVGDAFVAIFKIQKNDTAALYTHFASLLVLVDDVENRLRSLDDSNRSEYLQCFEPIKRAFQSTGLQHSVDQMRNTFTPSDLALLKLASQRLDEVQYEISIPQGEISSLETEVADLFKTISASELPAELRVIVLDLLEAIRRTLSEYQIRGAEGLKRVLAECMGRLILDKEIVVEQTKRPEVKRFLDLLAKLNTLFTVATNAHKAGNLLREAFDKIRG